MVVIILAAFFGLSAMQPDGETAKAFYITSGLLLVYIGISSILVRKNDMDIQQRKYVPAKYSGFLTGIILAVANPLSIAFWVSLSAKLVIDTGDISLAILNSASVVLGAVLFFPVLVSLVKVLKVRIKTNHLLLMSRLFGLLTVTYGIITLSQAL